MAVRTGEPQAARPAKPGEDRNPFAGVQYRWWWAMTFCVSLAVGMQIVTVPTFVLDRTDTRFYVALAVLCQTVPTALFTLVGGAAADRFGRQRILRVTLGIAACTSFVYILLSVADVQHLWPVFMIAAVVGSAGAFQNPTRQSLINRLAPGSRLQNGVILGTLAFMGGQSFIGPAIAGLTVSVSGLTAGFALEVALLLAAGACATRLRNLNDQGTSAGSLLAQIGAGLRYVRAHPSIWQVMILGAVPGMFFMGVGQATFPILSNDTFHRGAAGIAMLNAAMGTGTLTGSVLLARWGPRHHRGQWFIRSLPAGGLSFLLAGLAPVLPLSLLCLLTLGLGAAVFINFASTLLQTYTEPAFIGRVMSVYSLCFMAAVPLGNLHAGLSLQVLALDPRLVLVYSGICAGALGLLGFATLRAARTLD